MRIEKNTSNIVVVTLNEKQTTNGPDFLLELTNDYTKKSQVLSVVDISNFPEAYNKFIIYEPNDISLSPSGQWSYRFLEMTPTSPKDQDPDNAITVLETGICVVFDPSENLTVSDDTGDNDVNVIDENE